MWVARPAERGEQRALGVGNGVGQGDGEERQPPAEVSGVGGETGGEFDGLDGEERRLESSEEEVVVRRSGEGVDAALVPPDFF